MAIALEQLFSRFMPTPECVISDTGTLRPFDERQGFTVVSCRKTSSFISRLFRRCSPIAIIWRVISIYIPTLQSHSFGAWTHISKKCCEVIAPFFTHGNSAAAIVRISSTVGAKASVFCRFPFDIFGRPSHPMRRESVLCGQPLKATTAFNDSADEMICFKHGSPPAFTKTIPAASPILASLVQESNNGKPAKFLPSDVFEVFRRFVRFSCSHNCLPEDVVVRAASGADYTHAACLF